MEHRQKIIYLILLLARFFTVTFVLAALATLVMLISGDAATTHPVRDTVLLASLLLLVVLTQIRAWRLYKQQHYQNSVVLISWLPLLSGFLLLWLQYS